MIYALWKSFLLGTDK